MNVIKRYIGSVVWQYCELKGINLGRLTPIMFGWMIGSKGKKIKNNETPRELSESKG